MPINGILKIGKSLNKAISLSLSSQIKIQYGLLIFEKILALIRVFAHQIVTGIQIFFKISFCKFFRNFSKVMLYNSGSQVISQNASSIEKGSTFKVLNFRYSSNFSEIVS